MRNKQDKIFDNNFEAPDIENRGSMSFDLDNSVRGTLSEEELIHYEIFQSYHLQFFCIYFFYNST